MDNVLFDSAVVDDAVVGDTADGVVFDDTVVDSVGGGDAVIDENRRYDLLVMGHAQGAAESPGECLQAY